MNILIKIKSILQKMIKNNVYLIQINQSPFTIIRITQSK